ncbi:MAG: redox-regulated ATPase YchF [Candidatus Bathyarchaeia archaeon]
MPVLGITGKPNVGKSTFFSAATLATVPIANYPFTTKTANIGVAYVGVPCVCKEFGLKDEPVNSICLDGLRLVPVKLIDCPGLVPHAWEGRGLGNQFLDDVRKADALLLVVDAAGATDSEGRPCEPGTNDPVEDIRFLEEEFDMWLFQIIAKDWDRLARKLEASKENIAAALLEKLAGLQIKKHQIIQALSELKLESKNPTTWTKEELRNFAGRLRRISKPLLIIANKIDLPPADKNLERLKHYGYSVIPTCAEAELALRRASERGLIQYRPGDSNFKILKPECLTDQQRAALEAIRERVLVKWGSTGIQEALNHAYFKLLNMIAVFPVEDEDKLTDHKGRVLPDCLLVPYGTTASEFASLIHTELGENFVYGVEARSKRRIGEDYILKNGDVIKIVAAKARG